MNYFNHPIADSKIINWIGFAVSVIIGLLVYVGSSLYLHHTAETKFTRIAKEHSDAIERRVLRYENALRSGVAFFQGSNEVDRGEWHQFVETLNLKKYFPGVQGIGYSAMLSPGEVNPMVDKMRREGYSSFSLKPEGERERYSTILFLEPMDRRNVQAIGFDMFSEPIRREAMERACDSGEAAISGRVKLVQEIDEDVQAGFLMYLPLYVVDMPLESIDERRKALLGFIYSPFRAKDLMRALQVYDTQIEFEIYDGSEVDEDKLLYRSFQPSARKAEFFSDTVLHVGGRKWYVRNFSSEAFEIENRNFYPILFGLIGLGLYFLLLYIIVELWKSKRALRYEKETAQHYLDIVNVMILVLDSEKKVRLINRRGCEILGYPSQEILGKDFIDTFVPDQIVHEVVDISETLIHNENGAEYHENAVVTKNGEERLIGWRNTPLVGPNGTVIGILSSGEDITDIRSAQQRLVESEHFYRTIVSSVNEAIMILEGGIVIDCNEKAAELFEIARECLIESSLLDLAERIDCGVNDFKTYFSNAHTEMTEVLQCSYNTKNMTGDVKIIEMALSAFGSEADKMILIGRDITQKLEDEKRFKMQARQAQMGEMISMIAHQWRQPLAIINAITSQLRLKVMLSGEENNELTDNLIKIEEQSTHLSQTISEYRDFFRPEKPKEAFEMSVLLNNALHLVDHALKNHSIDTQISVHNDPKLYTFRNEVLQVIIALLKNSLDAFEEHGSSIPKVIQIMIDSEPGFGVITLRDNAGGIPAEIIEKIFRPYFTTKNKKSGTGLGLYMSKMLIEEHCAGILEVVSENNTTTFTIKLPMEEIASWA